MSLPITVRYSADGAKTRRIGKVSCPEEGEFTDQGAPGCWAETGRGWKEDRETLSRTEPKALSANISIWLTFFSGMFEHFRPILQGELVSHDLVDLDLAVFEIKVDVFRGQDSGLDLNR
jgi:hypothetical protein